MKSNRLKASVAMIVVSVVALAITAGCYAANKKNAKEPAKSAAKQLPKLLDLGATKCIPCKMMVPVLDELAKEYKGQLNVQFIDVWKNPDAAKRYRIKSIPTQIFFDRDGREFYRHEGFMPKADILKVFDDRKIQLGKGN